MNYTQVSDNPNNYPDIYVDIECDPRLIQFG